jgi:hypothetical protein
MKADNYTYEILYWNEDQNILVIVRDEDFCEKVTLEEFAAYCADIDALNVEHGDDFMELTYGGNDYAFYSFMGNTDLQDVTFTIDQQTVDYLNFNGCTMVPLWIAK